MFSFFYKQILFIVYFIEINYFKVHAGDILKQEVKLNALIEELHSMYKDAFENEKTYIKRRFFTKDGHSHYTLHVQKLKEVDGVKTHNLRLEGRAKQEHPIIYINNPVEARMPNPFLSIDEFKRAMFERIEKQKKEFDVNRNLLINANKQFKVFKHLETFTTEIFDVKKYVKQILDASKNMKTKGNHKENKKRKQKVHVSHTQPTRKRHILTKTALSKVPDTETETVAEEEITTESSADEETTTDATVSEEINTEATVDEKLTTGTPVNEEATTEPASDDKNTTQTTDNHNVTSKTKVDAGIITETIIDEKITPETSTGDEEATTETASDEKNTTQPTVNHEGKETIANDGIITETVADEDVNTKTAAAEEINTEIIDNKEITTEMITKEEIATEAVTTTESTVRTTRTKQLRPFVFMGDR